jgi:hypothetical protein
VPFLLFFRTNFSSKINAVTVCFLLVSRDGERPNVVCPVQKSKTKVAKLQKKAPNALKSLDAALKLAPAADSPAHRSALPVVMSRSACEFGAKECSGNFPARKALKNHKKWKESRKRIERAADPRPPQ